VLRARAGRSAGRQSRRSPAHDGPATSMTPAAGARQADRRRRQSIVEESRAGLVRSNLRASWAWEGRGHQVAPRSFHPDNPDPQHPEGTASRSHSAPATRRAQHQPDSGTMDTSRGPDGAIDSHADRQLRPTQGLHIMMWRQTWRQRWRPTRTPSPSHRHDSDREGRRESLPEVGLARTLAAGDHVYPTVSGVPSRVGASDWSSSLAIACSAGARVRGSSD
jgi:hypothetical protein